ncbi:SH2 domain-containing protein 1B-like [Hyperolius riggenbachi]|uniref:SH2 domain-containing protein 1B-like n=1 Tax=Hyperolius riggenbachi TaxID=752182 RepID=UPI0035A2B37B
MDIPCCHGGISKKTGENLLLFKGINGSYLVRDSETVSGALCLCVLYGRLIYTYRIYQDINGFYMIQTAEGVEQKCFKTLNELIFNYEKPNQGLIHSLSFPVTKDEAKQYHTQAQGPKKKILMLEEDTYAEIDEREYVEVLP